jgi:PAS domain S-box-containing protein
MKNVARKILVNLHRLAKSDLTCLIKFDQKSFELIDYVSRDNLVLDFSSIVKELDKLDFVNLRNIIQSKYNFSSFFANSFSLVNSQYFVLSAFIKDQNFSENIEVIHSELTESIEETLVQNKENSNNIVVNPNHFHLLAEASSEFIFTLDEEGNFTFINKYGYKTLKYNTDEIIGKHFFELITDEFKSKVAEVFQKIIKEKKQIKFDVEIIPKVSVEILFNIRLTPILKDGEMVQLLGVASNISEQEIEKKRNTNLIAKLKEANRINSIERDRAKQQISILSELNNLKNEFISNVSHELRTPLASIIGFSETIVDDKNLTAEKAREFTDVILTESKRLAKLINDVLDFSELENEKRQLEKNSVNIIEILQESKDNISKDCFEKGITLTSNLPESEIIIFADKNRIAKAMSYLLSNALKFTANNGRITVRAQEFLKEVEIIITDTGVGIPEQKLPLLFDKFSKVKRAGNNLPGAGFGLVTVKQIIDLHKGLIRVKSEVDKGTSFIIRLPKYSFN